MRPKEQSNLTSLSLVSASATLRTVSNSSSFSSPPLVTMHKLSGFNSFITNLITSTITIAGIMLLAYFMYGAVVWITASGDHKKLDEAKMIINNAIVGIILVVLSYFVVGLVGGILGIPNILSPIFPFPK